MLQFFRRYQKFFFILITAVVVVTFSFFGVNPAPAGSMLSRRDDVVSHTALGQALTRGDLEDMVLFLDTDQSDSRNAERLWGFNFLNDGVIRRDFIESGLAQTLFGRDSGIGQQLQERFPREKRYRSYRHPQAPFVNAEMAWNYFAPNLKTAYDALRAQTNPMSSEGIEARMALYLEQSNFPALALKQALLFQQQQYEWLRADPQLEQADLSLFGYHAASDWFGRRFVHLVAQLIFNGAERAEALGYSVSDDEVRADLLKNAQKAFDEYFSQPQVRISNAGALYQEQLRRMQLGEGRAVATWRKVMLFRRLFEDVGNAALVDPLLYTKLSDYANDAVEVTIYELPSALRLRRFADLQRFEVYRKAVAANESSEDLPKAFLSAEEVKKDYPELVQKRYQLHVSTVDKEALQVKVGVRETWNWQVNDEGWEQILQEFRDLALHEAKTQEERFAALQSLDGKARIQVDAFARRQIVTSHPEWLEQAMEEAEPAAVFLQLRLAGGKLSLEGVRDRTGLMMLLDNVELDADPDGELALFSQNARHYHRIKVLERSSSLELLSFAEASSQKVLEEILDRQLASHYQNIRESNPVVFRAQDGQWRPLAEVREEVARNYFQNVVERVNGQYHEWRKEQPATERDREKQQHSTEEDRAAARRFVQVLLAAREALHKDSSAEAVWVQESTAPSESDGLPPRPEAEAQWKLIKRQLTIYRNSEDIIDPEEAFTLIQDDWSIVHTPSTGSLFFYQRGAPVEQHVSISQQMDRGRELLAQEARRSFFGKFMGELESGETLKMAYLNREEETSVDEHKEE